MQLDKTTITTEDLRKLIEKYSGSIPRYTSYPTAVEFHDGIDSEMWRKSLDQEFRFNAHSNNLAIYVHIPFCHSLCYFCACNKVIPKDDSGVAPYLKAIERELGAYSKTFETRSDFKVSQFHWGGGTPNFLSPDASKELFLLCKNSIPELAEDADISVEIDPRTLTKEHLEAYRELGFNRVSAGVQDFNLDVQQAINRIQSFEDTNKTCQTARDLGFESLNLDLIYGLPNQTEESFRETIDKVLSIRPDRIALYGYAHVTWKKKVQKSLQRHDLPSPETRVNLFLAALDALTEAGYIYIGMDHFALPEDSLTQAMYSGKLNRNFMGYSSHKGAHVLGLGVSSISSIPNMLAQNNPDLASYMNLSETQGFAISRGIERQAEDSLRAEIIEDLLCNGHIDISLINKRWDVDFESKFETAIKELKAMQLDGLTQVSDQEIRVTPLGRLFMRNIGSVFDAYLEKHRESAGKRFSQSI